MALLFFEDFETAGAAFWDEATGTEETSIVYAGVKSWKFFETIDYHTIGDTHEIWIDFYWNTDTVSTNFHHVASFMALFFLIAELRVSTTGKLTIYRGTTLLATGTTTLLPNTWYHIAIHILRDATSGVLDVDLDGVSEITFAGDTGPNDFNRLRFGGGSFDTTDYYDNISGYDAPPVVTTPALVVDSDFSVAGASGIGIRVTNTGYIYQSRGNGAGYDLQIDSASEARIDDLTLVNATQNIIGTLVPLRSDRATWDTLTYYNRHASDISDTSFTYHVDPANPPLNNYLGSGSFFVGNGSNQAVGVTMSGDATLNNEGVLTIAPLAVDGSNIAVNNGSIFIGGVDGAAHEQTISGDASISNAGVLTLATVNATPGTYGDDTHLAQITVDAKGRITAIGTIVFTGGTGSGAPQVYDEIHSATGGTLYYLVNIASAATVRAYVNGIRQPVEDSIIDSDEVIFSTAPAIGDTLLFDYELSLV